MIDWSWRLLTDEERVVLRRLAVHADGAGLDAAAAVCAHDGAVRTDVLDVLSRLVEKSLVVLVDGVEPRYRLLESVSAYGRERLAEAGELDPVRHRHAAWYTGLAERSRPHLYGPDQRRWLLRWDAESANVRHALDTAVDHGDGELALRLVDAMAWPWFLRGRYREAHRAVTAALAVGSDRSPTLLRARVTAWEAGFALLAQEDTDRSGRSADVVSTFTRLDDPAAAAAAARAGWFLAYAHLNFGDLATGAALADDAVATARVADDQWTVAAALATRGTIALFRGGLPALRRDSEAALEIFTELGDRWGQLQAMDNLAQLAEVTGDHDGAARLHRTALRSAEELGLWSDASYQLAGLGRIALLDGDHRQAEELHERALRLATEQSNTFGRQFSDIGLGMVARRAGRFTDAERHLGAWLDWNRRLQADHGLALILAELGFVAEQRGDEDAALARHREGLAAARRAGDPRALALAAEGLAGAVQLRGYSVLAARLLGAAAAARDALGAPLPAAERGDVERITAALRATLGEADLADEERRGRDSDFDELLSHPHLGAPAS